MKTTKQEIKERLMNDDKTLSDNQAQQFVDDLFPNIEMNETVETDDE